MKYETVVGLEIHVELSTKSKMFCACPVPTLEDAPNTKTCPICLGLPGALPYANQKAIEDCIKIGLALNCTPNAKSFFERKNYFYPDLTKGFQTSQYLHPFGEKGYLDIEVNGVTKRIGITRVHMEEDTGKLSHSNLNGEDVSLIDFNRSGVPLVEIVTEPDIRSGEEAKVFLTELQKIIRYLGVSDADMEKGHMRLEPNISLRPVGQKKLAKYKVEVKNINSFKFVDKAIQFEEKRHAELLDTGKIPVQETRGWNEFRNETVSQRSKEEAHDYRYFPEPDIPPIKFTDEQVETLKNQIPELPIQKTARFISDYSLNSDAAEILTRDKNLADYFEETVELGKKEDVQPKDIANEIINKKILPQNLSAQDLVTQVKAAKSIATLDPEELKMMIQEVLIENPQPVADYKAGKETVLMFLIGQTMKKLARKADMNQVKNAILEALK